MQLNGCSDVDCPIVLIYCPMAAMMKRHTYIDEALVLLQTTKYMYGRLYAHIVVTQARVHRMKHFRRFFLNYWNVLHNDAFLGIRNRWTDASSIDQATEKWEKERQWCCSFFFCTFVDEPSLMEWKECVHLSSSLLLFLFLLMHAKFNQL